MLESDVFERTELKEGEIEISPNLYNLTIGIFVIWGFFLNFVTIQAITPEEILAFGFLTFLLYSSLCIIMGIYLITKSINTSLSLLGYHMVVIPFGLMINAAAYHEDPELVIDTVIRTGCATAIMMCLGTTFPQFFKKIGKTLAICGLAIITIELLGAIIFGRRTEFTDWAVLFIFCAFVAHDWVRAQSIPKTTRNAIDSAIMLYMDVINIFLRLANINIGRS